MSKFDAAVEDVKKIYTEMVAVTVRSGCKEGFSDVAAAILTQAVVDAEREERKIKLQSYVSHADTGPR